MTSTSRTLDSQMATNGSNFHFISGLPRSGSTLTAALLRQNPRFHAGMSSPVAGLYEGIVNQVSAGSELATMVDGEQRARILRGLFESYYAERNEPVIFDTNRAWTAKLAGLMTLFPKAKLICLVRDVAWIMDSLERQFQKNAFENTRLFGHPSQRATVYTRLDSLASPSGLVGFPYQALREACYSSFADRIVIVEYEMLTQRPAEVLQLIYQFLDEEPFTHDFDSLSYDAPEFDAQLGIDGLHRVHPKVAPRPRQSILPPELFQKFAQLAFWRELTDSKAFRITSKGDQHSPQQHTLPSS
ncbi:MAG: sulfotransferase [Verrucomicrobiota bacterium JB023]|nr:sulfotransferase [Verrucomicrobiota bacterium JB023]